MVNKVLAAIGWREAAEINQIISITDGIAFQTNLLVFNAVVQAAGAGGGCRAFAVVANKVRALAERSADAAKKIEQLIEGSGQEVVEGLHLVEAAGKMFRVIVDQAVGIETPVREIAVKVDVQAKDLRAVQQRHQPPRAIDPAQRRHGPGNHCRVAFAGRRNHQPCWHRFKVPHPDRARQGCLVRHGGRGRPSRIAARSLLLARAIGGLDDAASCHLRPPPIASSSGRGTPAGLTLNRPDLERTAIQG